MKAAVGGVEDLGTIDRDEQDAVVLPLEQEMLVLAVFHLFNIHPHDGAAGRIAAQPL
jgi:hypothetical protein